MPSSAASRFRFPSGLRTRDGLLGAWTAAVLVFLYLPIAVLVATQVRDPTWKFLFEVKRNR